jgi:soluble lytic murein transglycosylase
MRRGSLAIGGVCMALIIGGAAAEVVLLPRAIPVRSVPLKDTAVPTMTREELEAVLAKVGRTIPEETRKDLAEAVLVESGRAGYDPLFVLAMVGVESRFRLGVDSNRGARGLIQLKPSTFAWISAREPDVGGEELDTGEDPVVDVRLAVRYFRWLERRFGSRTDALMAYNAGPRRLRQYQKAGRIPDSLHEYPRRVKKEYERLVRIAGGYRDPAAFLIAKN